VSIVPKKEKRGPGRPPIGDRPMTAAERQSARRRRQNDAEATYGPLSPGVREFRAERNVLRNGSFYAVTTTRGVVKAGQVVMATDAYTGW
jgi:hypothetical protein